jgi:nitrite reductase (NADH) large subunit
MGKARQVIIGNSAAGLSAIKAIREVDRSCPITLISAEKCNGYSPVLIPYYLKGRIVRGDLFIVDSDFYKRNGILTQFGGKALAVDPLKQTVYLENSGKVVYDNLLIATGASPVSLDVSGEELASILLLRTIADADKVVNCAVTAKEVVIIGGGLVGLQIADALFREGIKITVLVSSRQLLSQNFDAECAAIVQKEVESHGIGILFGRNIREIRKEGKKTIVVSDSGEEWPVDMVVIGKGVRPNVELVSNSGIKVERGIWVDELMQTNMDNIFAAGDVVEGKNLVTGEREVLPNWSNACRQGWLAGSNMAGLHQTYEGGLRQNISVIFGLTIVAIGLTWAPEDNGVEELRFSDPRRKIYRNILLADNRIAGAILVGRTDDAGMLRNLIIKRKSILPWKGEISRMSLDMRKVLLSATS